MVNVQQKCKKSAQICGLTPLVRLIIFSEAKWAEPYFYFHFTKHTYIFRNLNSFYFEERERAAYYTNQLIRFWWYIPCESRVQNKTIVGIFVRITSLEYCAYSRRRRYKTQNYRNKFHEIIDNVLPIWVPKDVVYYFDNPTNPEFIKCGVSKCIVTSLSLDRIFKMVAWSCWFTLLQTMFWLRTSEVPKN